MKKILFLFTLVLAIALISGYKQSDPKGMTERNVYPEAPKDVKITQKTEGKPKILLLLTNSTGMSKWSPSLWWKYEHAKPGQTGC